VPSSRPSLSGRQVDSVSFGNYSSHANSLLADYNPQTDETPAGEASATEYVPPVAKQHKPAILTYAQAAAPISVASVTVPSAATTVFAITQDDVDKMFSSISQKFSDYIGSSLTIQALERQVQHTSVEIKQVQQAFQDKLHLVANSVDTLSARVIEQHMQMNTNVETLNNTISRQNLVIACIQKEFKETMADLYSKLSLSPPVFHTQEAFQVTASSAPQSTAPIVAQQLGGAQE